MSVVSARSRDRLREARERTRKAREERNRAKQGVEAARKLDDRQALATCEVRLSQAEDEIEMASEVERALLAQVAGIEHFSGESCLDDPQNIRLLENMAHSSQPTGEHFLGAYMDAEQFAGMFGRRSTMAQGSSGPGPISVPPDVRYEIPRGVIPQLYRPTRLLDILPTGTMEGLSFVYVREAGSLDSGAAETAELALKPEETGLDLTQEGICTAVTVAVFKKVGRQALDDTAGLATMINTRLTYLVERRIEAQVLAGNGTGGNLLGVLGTAGIGSVAFATGTPAADLILQGLTTVRLANAEPDAVLLHPTTYEGMLNAKASGSGERLDSGGAFVSPADSIWGVPVIQSGVISPSVAVCADWGRAVTLFFREGLNLRTSDSDQDDFVRNVLTVLAESRVGLAVWQPAAICEVHLS
jgi:HK97 family phage major capsid protein